MYLGFSVLWILGVFKENYWRIATVTNIIFMLGMGFGRILSMFLDGTPTNNYILELLQNWF